MWYLYTITNRVNGKQYIGIAKRPARRWIEHKCGHGSKLVYQAIQKYGLKNLSFDVLFEGTETDIKALEVTLIKERETKAPKGYNLTDGGEGTVGWKPSKETRNKMSQSRTGSRNGMYGKQHSKEAKQKIRSAAKQRDQKTRVIAGVGTGLKGSSNYNAKAVMVDGIHYGCIKDAAIARGCHPETLRRKFRHFRKTNVWPAGWADSTMET